MTLIISPKKVAKFLTCVVASIAALGSAAEWVKESTATWSHHGVTVLAEKFVLDSELSLPAWYSSIAIFACAAVLGLIAWFKHRSHSAFARHWTGLAVIFVLMSFDEMVGMHEMLIEPLRRYLGAHGIFHYAWVIPACVFVAGFAIAYLRFVFVHLDSRTRWRFVAAGVIYVGAALGMEMVEGPIDETYGVASLPAQTAVTIEETVEMLGIVYFLYALLCCVGELRVQIAGVTASANGVTDRNKSVSQGGVSESDLAFFCGEPESREEFAEAGLGQR